MGRLLPLCLLACLLALAPAFAQGDPAPTAPPATDPHGARAPRDDAGGPRGDEDFRDPERREELRKKIADYMLRQLEERLDLSDEQVSRLAPLLRERESARRSHLHARRDLVRELAAASADTATDDAALARKVEQLRAQEKAFREEQERRESAILAILTPRQQAGYVEFVERFPREMRHTLDELREGRHGRDGEKRRRRGDRMGPGRAPGAAGEEL